MTPKAIAADQGRTVSVIGNQITIRLHGRDTGGALSVLESVDMPGEGPPPHVHSREEEIFYVLEGSYEFFCGDQKFSVTKGATIYAPRGLPHSYRQVGATPGRLLVTISPAGFEAFFEEIGALSPAEQKIPHVIEIGERYGLRFLPPA